MIEISDSEKIAILDVARSCIRCAVQGADAHVQREVLPREFPHAGVFVTLHVDGQLRGCIGSMDAESGFESALCYAAERATRHDYRFDPIHASELEKVEIEVTILEPMEPVSDTRNIVIGRHGIMLEAGTHRGLLLPQVATQRGWSVEDFLHALCQKASLSFSALKNPTTRLYRFEATCISQNAPVTH